MAKDAQKLSAQHYIDLEAKYGCRNYEPLPVVLCRGEGKFYHLIYQEFIFRQI